MTDLSSEAALFIKRIQVDEGFLDGLDLEFSPNLNVLIGPRGSGKTSIVELIRFCLGVESVSDRFARQSREHALSILGSGRVTVHLGKGGQEIAVSRAQADLRPRGSDSYAHPLVFSQNEVEAVGLDAAGRLRILDGFVQAGPGIRPEEEGALKEKVRSFTSEILDVRAQVEADEERLAELAEVRKQLEDAIEEERKILDTVSAAEQDRKKLERVSKEGSELAVRANVLEQAEQRLNTWRSRFDDLLRKSPTLPTWPEGAAGDDLLQGSRKALERSLMQLRRISDDLASLEAEIVEIRHGNTENQSRSEDAAREIRKRLEELKEGAGKAALRVAALKERNSLLQAIRARVSEGSKRLLDLQRQRGELLNELDGIRSRRFEFRKQAAKTVTDELGPSVEVLVERGGQDTAYVNAIIEGLRGSGLHYNTLAPQISQLMSPRELVETIEARDAALLANVLQTTPGRAERVLEELANGDVGELLTIPVRDTVRMFLLDGADLKETPELSTGQRCTVILSVLLAQRGPPLVMDQPEDNLDNAFVVDTLIESIVQSKDDRQMIFATHNPNIPVLGFAERVIALGSDGRHGFVRHADQVDARASVKAITAVMEGGTEAFTRRANFYRDKLPGMNG